jgi:hypothetical protein
MTAMSTIHNLASTGWEIVYVTNVSHDAAEVLFTKFVLLPAIYPCFCSQAWNVARPLSTLFEQVHVLHDARFH